MSRIVNQNYELEAFLLTLSKLKSGYHTGYFDNKQYGVSISRPVKEKVTKLYAEELGGTDIVSFNIFSTKNNGAVLKPCEMSSEKVIEFVLNYKLTS